MDNYCYITLQLVKTYITKSSYNNITVKSLKLRENNFKTLPKNYLLFSVEILIN